MLRAADFLVLTIRLASYLPTIRRTRKNVSLGAMPPSLTMPHERFTHSKYRISLNIPKVNVINRIIRIVRSSSRSSAIAQVCSKQDARAFCAKPVDVRFCTSAAGHVEHALNCLYFSRRTLRRRCMSSCRCSARCGSISCVCSTTLSLDGVL